MSYLRMHHHIFTSREVAVAFAVVVELVLSSSGIALIITSLHLGRYPRTCTVFNPVSSAMPLP